MKKVALLFCLFTFLLAMSTSFADTVSLSYLGVEPKTAVKVIMDNFYNGSVYAGNYKLGLKDSQGEDLGTFLGFCIDMAYAPPQGQYKDYELQAISEDRHKVAAYILYRQFHQPGQIYNDAVANQIAVWEIVFDWNNFDLGKGNFILNQDPYKTEAQTVIDDALSNYLGWNGYSSYFIAHHPVPGGNGNYQDYIIPNPNPFSPVPIPSPFLLVLSGLFGLFGVRRRVK